MTSTTAADGGAARAGGEPTSETGPAADDGVPEGVAASESRAGVPVGALRRRPAMHDVARVAGVSHQTVSRVLNDHPNVRAATRERVLAAIAELGYRRNSAARALVTRRSGIIGVVTLSSSEFGPTSTIIALETAAYAAGFHVSLTTLPDFSPAQVSRVLEHFLDLAVEGVVIIAPVRSVAKTLRPFTNQVPVVTIASGLDAEEAVHALAVDQRQGAALATRHLIGLGHREIVHVRGPESWLEARERELGWRDELGAAGLAAPEPFPADWTAARGYEVGLEIVRGGVPSAVFAANDQLALGLLRAFAERGVRVPHDVSVVGFDDLPGADNFQPPLTTVRQDFDQLGFGAIELLLAVIAGEPYDNLPIIPRLIVRASTGPAPPGS